MSAVSLLEDITDRAIDDALSHGACPVSALWFDELLKSKAEKELVRAALAVKEARAKAEAEAARLESRTREYVEGHLLWREEIKDVIPLRHED